MQIMHTPQTSLNYRRDIDGLRSFAILHIISNLVRVCWTSGVLVGLDILFAISGALHLKVGRNLFLANSHRLLFSKETQR